MDHKAPEMNPLLLELKKVMNELQDYKDDKKDHSIHIQTKYQRCLARLCYMIEKILEHGIKDVSLFGTGTYFWSYLENLDKCLPGADVKSLIKKVKDTISGNLGRGRVFIRVTLNDGSFIEYISALAWNTQLTTTYYRETAILRNEHHMSLFIAMLDNIKPFKFDFVLKDKALDDPDYWDRYLARKPTANGISVSTVNMLVPSNLSDLTKSTIMPSLEAINCIIEQTESQEKELQEIGRRMLDVRVQLEREKQEKEILLQRNKRLEQQFNQLTEKLRDMEVELMVYRSTDPSIHSANVTEEDSLASVNITEEQIEEQRKINELSSPENSQPASKSNSFVFQFPEEFMKEITGQQANEVDEKIDRIAKRLSDAQVCIQQMKSFDDSIKQKLLRIPSQDLKLGK